MASVNALQRQGCEICGFNRAVDRCHIIPYSITHYFLPTSQYREKTRKYETDNIIILCKNHHFVFDHAKLEKEEFDKIEVKVMKMHKYIIEAVREDASKGLIKNEFVDRFVRWEAKISPMISNFYGHSETK